MVLPAALTADIFAFFSSLGLDPALTAGAAADVRRSLGEIVPSCLGLRLDLVDHGVTVTLTSFQPLVQASDIVTSLHIPLLALGLLRLPPTAPATPTRFDAQSSLTLYGSRSGGFVDLAADLSYALRRQASDRRSRALAGPLDDPVTLDQHLTPASTTSGLVGAEDLSTVNRAIGYLIGQGHHPETVAAELGQRAAAAGLTVLVYAAQLLGR